MQQGRLSKRIARYNSWHRLVRIWNLLQHTTLWILTFLAVYCLADRLVYLDFDFAFAAWIAASAGTFFILVAFLVLRRRTSHVGYLIDHHAELDNLISSGIEVENNTDPVSQLVLARADQALDKHNPRTLMPLAFNRGGKLCVLPLLAVIGLSNFMPHQDLFNRKEVVEVAKEEKEKRVNSAKLINQTVKTLKTIKKDVTSIKGKSITDDMMKLANDLEQAPTRKEALSKLNSLEKRYKKEFNEQRNFEKATRNMTARLNAQDLNKNSRDLLKNLSKQLRQNDFKGSSETMRQLAEQMAGNELNDNEKQAMAREMKQMMDQMRDHDDAQQLSRSLQKIQQPKEQGQQAGKQKQQQDQMAQKQKNQQGKKNTQQSKQPKQQGQKQQNQMAQNQNAQDQNCDNPGSKMGMQSGAPSPNGQQQAANSEQQQANQMDASDQMNQMADSLEQMEGMKQMQEGLDRAKEEMVGNEFKGFNPQDIEDYLADEQSKCPGCGQGGCPGGGQCPGGGNGSGTGGKGQGSGGNPPEQQTATNFKDEFSASKTGKGKILNQMWVYGVPEKGETKNEYTSEVRNAKEDAMSSLAKNPVPREYENMVKEYFSSLDPTQAEEQE